MAQVDTGIYQNLLRPPKSVQEYDAEAQQAEGNKLGLLLQRGQYDAQQRGVVEESAFRNALSSGADDKALMAASPTRALALQEGRAKIAKEQALTTKATSDAKKTDWEAAVAKQAHIAQLASSATDQASWTQARKIAQALGADVSQVPEQFDPATAKQFGSMAMTQAQRLDQAHKEAVLSETTRNNKAQNGIAMRGQDITVRGQNMTDSRARDFNAVQVEGNNIKRDEKKATQDLTKNSQVASFDTMLGTLDRLTKHPGLSRSVGVVGAFPTMPGSESANFQAELDTFQSQAFIPMVAQLKGMGALSDAEGKKLTAAVGALNPKMGEQAFRDSVARITADMEAARTRVADQPRAGGASGEWGGAASKAPKAGAVDGGYRFKGGNPADKSNWEKVK